MNTTLSATSPRFQKDVTVLRIGDLLSLADIQKNFNHVPLDPYVKEGFRHKSIARVYARANRIEVAEHGPLYQPKGINPIHGGIARNYEPMQRELTNLLSPAIRIFSACAGLQQSDEILVQAQRITATSGDDGRTGFPVVEGWHQDNIDVLGILLVNRVNISGGISFIANDSNGSEIVFAQTLQVGDLLLTNDRYTWHNTTPIREEQPGEKSFRDIVILSSPANRDLGRSVDKESEQPLRKQQFAVA